MGNAALVIDNLAANALFGASSQALTMPLANILTPHPSERWRSLSNSAYFVADKGSAQSADTVMIGGLTCGVNATLRLRLSTIDNTGAAGDILDTGAIANGDAHFDVEYGSFVYRLASPASWRYVRVDISDPDASFVEAGCLVDGLSEAFTYNFIAGSTVQHTDRSRVSKTSSGMTLTWLDNTFRTIALSFDFVTSAQRYGVVERLDRVKGKTNNVLLMTNTDSDNLPRDSIFGLVSDQTAIAQGPIFDIFGKQLKIEERV